MTTLRAQMVLQSDTLIPRDMCVNTFHFVTTDGLPAANAAIAQGALQNLYTGIQERLSPNLTGIINSKWYDLEDATPRVPIFEHEFTVTVSAGTPLPNEVAICLSFQAVPQSGVPVARRRGRVFLGPWDTGVIADGGGDAVVDADFLGELADLAHDLAASGASADVAWAVFSPTTAGPEPWTSGEILAATFNVASGWIDNAFDTVRSRGVAAASRVTFTDVA